MGRARGEKNLRAAITASRRFEQGRKTGRHETAASTIAFASEPEAIEVETTPTETILERLGLSAHDLTEMVEENPSLAGFIIGYAAERKLKDLWFQDPLHWVEKPSDHDRRKKGDGKVFYEGYIFDVESKSLQSRGARQDADGRWKGTVQCDASDRRDVVLPSGAVVNTTCLRTGEFDILAVNCFAFDQEWNFQFAKNTDLPRTTYNAYNEEAQEHLLATAYKVTWPPTPPFVAEPFSLLDELVAERREAGVAPTTLQELGLN